MRENQRLYNQRQDMAFQAEEKRNNAALRPI